MRPQSKPDRGGRHAPQAQDCIADLITSNQAMQAQLDEMSERLQESKSQIGC